MRIEMRNNAHLNFHYGNVGIYVLAEMKIFKINGEKHTTDVWGFFPGMFFQIKD